MPGLDEETQVLELEVETEIWQQRQIWESTSPYLLYLGGVGAGKTFTGAVWSITKPEGTHGLIVAPTHKNLLSGALATMLPMLYGSREMPDDIRSELEKLEAERDPDPPRVDLDGDFGPPHSLVKSYNKQDGEIRLIDDKLIFLRSLDRPHLVRGANVDWLWIDEPGIIKDKETWNILIARVRRSEGQRLGTTTPPPTGKNHWLHESFVENAVPGVHEVVKVRTRDNPYNPASYEVGLRREFAEAYAARELDAEWIDVGEVDVYDVEKLLIGQIPADIVRTARAWDTAATGGGGDYTAGILLSADKGGRLYIRDVVRGQWEPHQRDQTMLRTAEGDRAAIPGTLLRVVEEKAGAGKSQTSAWIRLFVGHSIQSVPESGDKVVRAGPLAAQVNAGNVCITMEPGRWQNYWHEGKRLTPEQAVRRFRQNLGRFPQGRTKDESDAGATALQAIVKKDSGITMGSHRG